MHILVRGARQLLTLHGPKRARRGAEQAELGLIRDGAVLIRDGVVMQAGPSRRVENLREARGAEEINATGRVVMPGFIDSHTHLVCGAAWVDEYEARLAVAASDFLHMPDLKATFRGIEMQSTRRLEARAFATAAAMVRHGTTSVEAKSGYGGNTSGELKILRVLAKLDGHPLDVTPTVQAMNWGEATEGAERIEWMRSEMLPKVRRRKLARFADIRCDERAFSLAEARAFLQAARELGFLLKVSAAESAGPGGGVRLAVEMGAVSADHLAYAGVEEALLLARSGTIATLTPGWSYYLGERYAPARELIARGTPVALASGWDPHTSPACSMQTAISLACSQMKMTPAEAIVGATVNGAHALRLRSAGTLEEGSGADLLLLNAADYREIPYHFGMNLVHMTMKRGRVVYREGAVVRGA